VSLVSCSPALLLCTCPSNEVNFSSINVSDSNFLWVELHKKWILLGSEMCVEILHEYLVCLRINRILKTDLLYSVWSISHHMYYISMRVFH